jgi:predicted permease
LRSRSRSLLHRQRLENEMAEELRFHIDSYASDLRRQGVAVEEAFRRARLEFGALEKHKEECRESLGLRLWDELRNDLRSGFRVLRQSPVFTAVAIVSLALGIGANTAIFTLANDFLLKTMGVPHPDRLRLFTWVQPNKRHIGHIWGSFDRNETGEGIAATFPYPLYQEMWHNKSVVPGVMQDIACFKDLSRLTAVVNGEAEPVDAILVSGNFYQTLGARVEAGRAITPTDDNPSAEAVIVISDAYWSSRFARSADALGKIINLNSVPVTIVGVNAPEFKGPQSGSEPQIFFALQLQPRVVPDPKHALLTQKDLWGLFVIGRLKSGVNDDTAATVSKLAFRNAFRGTLPEHSDADLPRLVLQPGARGFDWGQKRNRKPIYLLLAVAGLVLLIACANLANLLLARATVRQREISLRLAMGAGRGRILRQILTESWLLAFLGGAAGLLLGYLGRDFIPRLNQEAWRVNSVDVQLDGRVFAFTFAVTAGTGLLFGIIPAWRCTQTDANAALKATRRMSASKPKAFAAKVLVVFQVALSLLLVVGAGLFVRTLLNLRTAPTGMDTEHIVLFELNPPQARFSMEKRVSLFQQVAESLATLPGVEESTSSSEPLLANNLDEDCYTSVRGTRGKNTMTNVVGTGFFATFGIPILNGRSLDQHDNQKASSVAVVNKAFAQSFFPAGSAVGQSIYTCDALAKPIQIVGVSADAKYSDIREPAPPTIYVPFTQEGDAILLASRTFEIKTAASLASVVPKIREAVRRVDRNLPVLEVRTQTEQIDAILTTERMFAVLTSGFGLLALILASIEIYGVMAYTVSGRTNEIGIRMALGAQARSVLTMVLGETFLLAILGIVTGLLAAFGAAELVASMLFGLKPNDPLTFAGATIALLLVALGAAILPAWRAATVDPLNALRHE